MHQVGGVSRLEEMEKSNQFKDRCVGARERELWPLSFFVCWTESNNYEVLGDCRHLKCAKHETTQLETTVLRKLCSLRCGGVPGIYNSCKLLLSSWCLGHMKAESSDSKRCEVKPLTMEPQDWRLQCYRSFAGCTVDEWLDVWYAIRLSAVFELRGIGMLHFEWGHIVLAGPQIHWLCVGLQVGLEQFSYLSPWSYLIISDSRKRWV